MRNTINKNAQKSKTLINEYKIVNIYTYIENARITYKLTQKEVHCRPT